MKLSHRILALLGLIVLSATSQAATQFSEKDYNLYAGDFNGDGKSDLLYIGKTPDKPNGIALGDANGAPQLGFQSWSATYLGIPWSTGQFVAVVGDFNGDGKSDVLMQSASAGTSYLLLANTSTAYGAVGQLVGINQSISQSAFGVAWSADQHKLFVGDFDGDGRDDLLFQAIAKGGNNAIVLADGSGGLFSRSSSNCWAGGPQQCWTDGEQGLSWSTQESVLTVGKFNGDTRSDILYQPIPKLTLIDFEIPIPVPLFKANTFGIFLGQVPDGNGRIIRTANQLWSKSDLGGTWSPRNGVALAGDFNGDGYGDVLLQAKGGTNKIFYANAAGVIGSGVAMAGSSASWNGNTYRALVGKFGNSSRAVLYLQSKITSGDNYYTSDISAGSVAAYSSPLQTVANFPSSATAVGATPATADVTQNGSAAYTIPIQLPKGTAGLTPDLSLTYSSTAGNGLVGVGWNLSGLGIITRCPKTPAQDGVTLDVQLLASDQYCLNGNRLRLVSGTQGAAGSAYRTELETYALVTAGAAGTNGPLSFTVKTKDGLIYEYGGTPDSRIGVPGNASTTRVWALSKINDRALTSTTGNYWTVTYVNDVATTGAYRPDYIDYTTSTAASPSAAPYRVKFTYGNRNTGENLISYYHGGRINQDKRLIGVELQVNGGATQVRKYTLAYQTPASTFNVLSRLASVQECSPSACMEATSFDWSNTQLSGGVPAVGDSQAELGFASYSDGTAFPPWSISVRSYTLDINGDGIPDAFQFWVEQANPESGNPPTLNYGLYIGTPTGQVTALWGTPTGWGGVLGVYDIDEDGKEDLMFSGGYLHQRANGSYGLDPMPYSMPSANSLVADVNGDGYPDSLSIQIAPANQTNTSLSVALHNTDGSAGYQAPTVVYAPPASAPLLNGTFWLRGGSTPRDRQTITYADFDGDGRQDVLVMVSNGWRVLYANGSGFTEGELIVPASANNGLNNAISSYFPPVPIDVNGDGCTDLAYAKWDTGTAKYYWYLARSTCAGFSAAVSTGIEVTGLVWTPSEDDWGSASAADLNGDGSMDLISGRVALLSNGDTLASTLTVSTSQERMQIWQDRNGDGVLDYVTGVGGPSDYAFPGLGKKPNYLVSATDGFGKVVKFEYAPMTESSVYTRGSGTSGRTRDAQSPMYVVKTMTTSDGAGSNYTQTYRYSGAKRNIRGRGFLGVATREVTDTRTGFVTLETYNNSVASDDSLWQFVGTLANRTVYQSKSGSTYGPVLEDSSQTWNSIMPDSAANRRYPYVSQSSLRRYELNGVNGPSYIASTSIATLIDNYGTPYDITTTTTEGVSGLYNGSSSTIRQYTPLAEILNDASSWCITRPKRLEDQRSHTLNATDGALITRVSTQAWDAAKCRVTHKTVAPASGYQLDTDIEYDNFNNISKTTETGNNISAAPMVTEWNYGGNGHLLQWAKNAKSHYTSFGWSIPYAFKTSETIKLSDAATNSVTTTWVPDDFGREKEMIRPDSTRTFKRYFICSASNSYCGDNLVRYVVRTEERNSANDANNLVNYADRFFDVMGRVKYEQSRGFGGQTVATATLYDSRGNVTLKTNPFFAGAGSVSGVSMEYDLLNRLTQTRRPVSDADRTIVSEYVVYEGLKTRNFDANGHETSKVGTVLGTVARSTDDAGKNTLYTYNSFGELLTATDPGGNVSSIHYIASRGFKDYSDDPDMGHLSFTYDALGQVLTQTDAKSQTTAFTYDSLGRMTTRIDHGGGAANTTTFTFDTAPGGYGVGQLHTVTSPGSYSETYAYDSKARRSQMTTVAAGTSFVMDYGYDASIGKLSTITYPASTGTRLSVSYGYQYGFTKEVRNVATNTVLWQANAQDPRGHVTQEQYGNGQVTNLGFDQTNGRLYTVQTGASNATQNLAYSWDAVGNLSSRADLNQSVTETFGYDALYRVTSVLRNGTSALTVAYDDIGNITNKSDVGGYSYTGTQATCSYTGLTAQPHAVRNAGGSVYCYDANGNMTKRSGATVTWSTYNYPLTINQAGGNTSTFSYGANRNKYRQVEVDGSITEDRITIAEGAFEKLTRGTTTEYRHYVQVAGKAVAYVLRSTPAANDGTFYLHEDHLGSVDTVTNAVGTVVLRTSFDAWGQRRSGGGWSGTPSAADKSAVRASTHLGFTGHDQLDNLNLVHMKGRVYDPAIGRFLSADPIIQDPYHSQSFNRYTYVWNNPLNSTDPTGFCTIYTPPDSRIQREVGCDKATKLAAADQGSNSPVNANGQAPGATRGQSVSDVNNSRSGQTSSTKVKPEEAKDPPAEQKNGDSDDESAAKRKDQEFRELTPEEQRKIRQDFLNHRDEIYRKQDEWQPGFKAQGLFEKLFGRLGAPGKAVSSASKVTRAGSAVIQMSRTDGYRAAVKSYDRWEQGGVAMRLAEKQFYERDWEPYSVRGSSNLSVDFYYHVTGQEHLRPATCKIEREC